MFIDHEPLPSEHLKYSILGWGKLSDEENGTYSDVLMDAQNLPLLLDQECELIAGVEESILLHCH